MKYVVAITIAAICSLSIATADAPIGIEKTFLDGNASYSTQQETEEQSVIIPTDARDTSHWNSTESGEQNKTQDDSRWVMPDDWASQKHDESNEHSNESYYWDSWGNDNPNQQEK